MGINNTVPERETTTVYRPRYVPTNHDWHRAYFKRETAEDIIKKYFSPKGESEIHEEEILIDHQMMKGKSLLDLLKEEDEHLRNYKAHINSSIQCNIGIDTKYLESEKEAYLQVKTEIKQYFTELLTD